MARKFAAFKKPHKKRVLDDSHPLDTSVVPVQWRPTSLMRRTGFFSTKKDVPIRNESPKVWVPITGVDKDGMQDAPSDGEGYSQVSIMNSEREDDEANRVKEVHPDA